MGSEGVNHLCETGSCSGPGGVGKGPAMPQVAAFYRFTPFAEPGRLCTPLLEACQNAGVTGTILLAPEGVNGTISGDEDGLIVAILALRALPGCADLQPRMSWAEEPPFGALKVRLKREIVTMGQPGLDPISGTGAYIAPANWNALVDDPGTVLIDTRNAYEIAIGTFRGAVDPGTEAFGDFPVWWRAEGARFAGKRVAMFCTGGIRCEKSTAFLRAEGIDDVVHLRGGILAYLEDVPEADSRWDGACFVFDGRVSVGHGLRQGPHGLCHACRRPVGPEDRQRPEWEEGVACHNCADRTSRADKARFRQRMIQMHLAKRRGQRHLGAGAAPA